ncbi:tRNA1(Val) (adenine(37)-N6)-methyltransferase [Phenylobacterium sp. J367]|uniref:tRNA1(Val) (adenine(37)-N6)-methyltransferase n=1 Tax=Phenylobacterium sp. J367 TaxID=2898435 RepID=UPI002151B015|nr:methyltransferase domain-containing protein [Phenylobacterium sp. J367]MCR5877094.1 methyltransferase [Phenylobacterium sp. J367]
MDEITEDLLLDGRVRLRQTARGYRAGLDAALLAAACDAGPGQRVMEAGCGPGGALLAAAVRRPGARFTGVERAPDALALAQANIALNGLEDRVEAIAGDVGLRFSGLRLPAFDAAMANPPFFDDAGAIRGPAAARRAAWMADDGLEAWITFLSKGVRPGGALVLIHRADRLADILGFLAPKAGSVQVLPVHPFEDAPAKRVLVRAIKSGKAPLRMLPPLVLHERGETGHRPQVEAILRGEAALSWL